MSAICGQCGHFEYHATSDGDRWHGCRPECHATPGENREEQNR